MLGKNGAASRARQDRASSTTNVFAHDRASSTTIARCAIANGAHDVHASYKGGRSMGDKNPKQKTRQDAQKQTDKNAKAAKTKANAPAASSSTGAKKK